MSITTCIRHPEKSPYIQLFAWQVAFCQNNHCAALLLAYFISWHDWKLRNDQYYQRANDIAEMHSDGRPHNENAYLFFSTDQLIDGCMGLYGRKAVTEGLEFLVQLGVISVHKNPNPRYHFDKTKYFQFYPEICNQWISEHYPVCGLLTAASTQAIDSSDKAKIADRIGKKALPSRENNQPSGENRQAITDTTNNTTNQNKSINAHDDFQMNAMEPDLVETIVEVLIEKGMPRSRFYPDAIDAIQRLHAAGATLNQFVSGFDIALKYTKGNGFGVNYLIKVVDTLVVKAKKNAHFSENDSTEHKKCPEKQPNYRNDLKNAEKWAADLL